MPPPDSQLDEAETVIREAIAGSIPSVEEQIDLAAIELKRGHVEAATMAFQQGLVGYSPAYNPLLVASYYFDSKRVDSAIGALEQAFTIEPACAQWLTRTNVPFFSPLRTDPLVRTVLARDDRPY